MFNLNEQEAVGRSRCCLFAYFFKPDHGLMAPFIFGRS